MLNIEKNMRPVQDFVEECLPAHLLCVALKNIVHDKDEKYVADSMVSMLDAASISPLTDMNKVKVINIAKMVEKTAKDFFKNIPSVSTYREAALVIALFNVSLLKDFKFRDSTNQGMLIAALIVDEAQTYGDWGDVEKCRAIAGSMRDHISKVGLYL